MPLQPFTLVQQERMHVCSPLIHNNVCMVVRSVSARQHLARQHRAQKRPSQKRPWYPRICQQHRHIWLPVPVPVPDLA
eukprot:3888398-Rhodomonas_salina.1